MTYVIFFTYFKIQTESHLNTICYYALLEKCINAHNSHFIKSVIQAFLKKSKKRNS